MNRQSFGSWGLDLDAGRFAAAIAALGIVQNVGHGWPVSENDIPEFLKLSESEFPDPLQWRIWVEPHQFKFYELPEASAFSDAWIEFCARVPSPHRFQILDGWYGLAVPPIFSPEQFNRRSYRYKQRGDLDSQWLVNQLVQSVPDDHGVSVSFADTDMIARTEWAWPLTVGFLDDAISNGLRREIEATKDWSLKFVRLITITKEERTCDLLLLPGNAQQALVQFLALEPSPVASCVILLDETGGDSDQRVMALSLIRLRSRCSALVLYRNLKSRRWSWFKEFLRELSHNYPLDTALFRCSRSKFVRHTPPVVISNPLFCASTRLSRQAELAHARLLEVAKNRRMVAIPPDLQARLHISKGVASINDVADLVDNLRHGAGWDYEEERKGATTLNLVNRLPELSLRPEPVARPVRLIQASVTCIDPAGRDSEQNAKEFRSSRLHRISVRIGTFDSKWINAKIRFPDQTLPNDDNGEGHRLVVVFSEPRLSVDPQVAEILLPHFGPSSECEFMLHLPESPVTEGYGVEARIVVLFRNRVLQTGILCGPVAGWPKSRSTREKANERIQIAIDALPRTTLENLGRRTSFDAAFVVNKNVDDRSRAFVMRDTDAKVLDLEGQNDLVAKISTKLSELEPGRMPIGSDALDELMYFLACQGSALYRGLIIDNGLESELDAATHIQIVAAKAEAFLPLEFLYDKKYPIDDAPLCRHAAHALKRGRCSELCADDGTVVCPLGFWCLNRTIERHMHSPELARARKNGDFWLLQAEPDEGRDHISVLSGAAFAASTRVDQAPRKPREKLFRELTNATNNNAWQAVSWTDWEAIIAKHEPSLLVLLPHTDIDPKVALPFMEISTHKLKALAITKAHVLGASGNKPVVLLLGCETGLAIAPCADFVAAFRRTGAALVLSTTAIVLGRHATSFASELTRLIGKSVKKGPAPFGELLLQARRKMFSDGYPMSLCLVSYGDADWILE